MLANEENLYALPILFCSHYGLPEDPKMVIGMSWIFKQYSDAHPTKVFSRSWLDGLVQHVTVTCRDRVDKIKAKHPDKRVAAFSTDLRAQREVTAKARRCLDEAVADLRNLKKRCEALIATAICVADFNKDSDGLVMATQMYHELQTATDPNYVPPPEVVELLRQTRHERN